MSNKIKISDRLKKALASRAKWREEEELLNKENKDLRDKKKLAIYTLKRRVAMLNILNGDVRRLPDGDFIIVIPKYTESQLMRFSKEIGEKLKGRKRNIFVVNTPLYIEQQFIHKTKIKEIIQKYTHTSGTLEIQQEDMDNFQRELGL